MKKLTKIEEIEKLFKDNNYKFFVNGDYNVNIFSMRNKDLKSNAFNDVLYIAFKVDGEWKILSFPVTTDPGVYYREKPMNVNGTAILAAGQNLSSHQIGLHQGRYEALVQRRPVRVYRDNNRDRKLDLKDCSIESGLFGINIHHAGENSTQVDKWSAGCTVFAKKQDFDNFMTIVRESAKTYGNSFTYTLFEE